MSTRTIGVAEYVLKLRDEMTASVQGIGRTIETSISPAMLEIGRMAGEMGDAIIDGLQSASDEAISFESAFADVRKTIDASEEEYAAFNEQIKQMSLEIPVAAKELAGIAANAGQLGIHNENVMGFVRTIADLGVASNLTGEQAATMLARFANITNMPQDQFSNLASAIVDLGNNFATTEAEIVEMSMRLAAAGEVVGMTEPEILALATTLSSVGIEAEAGGSAFSKVMVEISAAVSSGGAMLDNFAAIAGTSAEQFASKWRNEPAAALQQFIEGLGQIHKSGGDVFGVLESIGVSEVRMRQALLSSATAGDLLSRAMNTANDAFRENVALTDEATKRYATTESQLQILQNNYDLLKIEIGEALLPVLQDFVRNVVPIIQAVAEWIRNNQGLVESLVPWVIGLGGLGKAMGMVTAAVERYIAFAAMLKITNMGAAAATTAAGAAATTATPAIAGVGAAAVTAAAGFAATVTAVAAGSLALAAIGISAANTVIEFARLKDSNEALDETMERYIQTLEAKGAVIDRDKVRQMEHGEAMRYLAEQEAASADNLTRAYIANVAQRSATDQEFATAKNLLLNENIRREEAALLATMNLAEDVYQDLLRADANKTKEILANLEVRVDGETKGYESIRDLSTDVAKQQLEDAQKATSGITEANQKSANEVGSIWQSLINALANAWNSFLAMFGMGGPAIPPADIPAMATGGMITGSGLVNVHKDELIALPKGAEVIPKKHSPAVAAAARVGGGGVTININHPVVREEQDIRRIADQVSKAIGERAHGRMRNAGLTPNFGV